MAKINRHRGLRLLLKAGFAHEDKEGFFDNLSMLLLAGMDIYGALQAIGQESRSKTWKKVIAIFVKEIDNGTPLWLVISNLDIYSRAAVSLIKNGEASGRLAENLKVLVSQQQKEKEFYGRIRSAMIYPSFVMFLAIIVALGTSWFVLPRISRIFDSMHAVLPWSTVMMINFGQIMANWGYIIVPGVFFGLSFIFYFFFIFKKTKFIGQFFAIRFPGIGKLIKQAEIARGTYIMGALLESGLPIIDVLTSIENSTEIRSFRNFYHKLRLSTDQGNSFQKFFKSYKHIDNFWPPSITQLVAAAENSGNLPQVFLKIASAYESKVDTTAKNLAVILEPVMLIIVWLGVLGVAVSIILPVYGLISSINV